jgi:hypothetical protein
METPKTQRQKQQQPQSQNYNKSKEGTGITTTTTTTTAAAAAAAKPLNKTHQPTKNLPKKTQPNPITETYHHNSKDLSHEFVEKSKSGVIPKPESPPLATHLL